MGFLPWTVLEKWKGNWLSNAIRIHATCLRVLRRRVLCVSASGEAAAGFCRLATRLLRVGLFWAAGKALTAAAAVPSRGDRRLVACARLEMSPVLASWEVAGSELSGSEAAVVVSVKVIWCCTARGASIATARHRPKCENFFFTAPRMRPCAVLRGACVTSATIAAHVSKSSTSR